MVSAIGVNVPTPCIALHQTSGCWQTETERSIEIHAGNRGGPSHALSCIAFLWSLVIESANLVQTSVRRQRRAAIVSGQPLSHTDTAHSTHVGHMLGSPRQVDHTSTATGERKGGGKEGGMGRGRRCGGTHDAIQFWARYRRSQTTNSLAAQSAVGSRCGRKEGRMIRCRSQGGDESCSC